MTGKKRTALAKYEGVRIVVIATVGRRAKKSGYRGDVETLLLTDLKSPDGEVLTDHKWLTAGKWASALKEGQIIQFEARVGQYERGYFGQREGVFVPHSTDFQLERPTKVKVIE